MFNFVFRTYYLDKMNDYEIIVNDWYLRLRNLFINTIHKQFSEMTIEDIEDVYNETFLAVRKNLIEGTVKEGTNWKSYIFKIGLHMTINKVKKEGKTLRALDQPADDDIDADEKFLTRLSLKDLVDDDENKELLEKRLEVLGREIRYLPEPCETILKSYYYGQFTLTDIMVEIHYKSTDAVKAMKYRCMNRLKDRIKMAFKMLDLTD